MVRLLARTLNFLLLGVVCINTEIRADLFQAEPLVQIPGFNTQFTVLKHESPTQIAWVNILDDLYSIYVQQIFYEIEAPVLVVSGNNPIYDPGIIYTLWGEEKTGLVWSDCDSTGWSLNYKEYLNGAWGDTFVIVDSLSDSIRSSAGSNGVSWTSSGSLYYFRLFGLSPDSTWQFPTLIDTFGCNNPQIIDDYSYSHLELVYEKQLGDSNLIKSCSWSRNTGEFRFETLSIAEQNRNPRIGPSGSLSFESFQDSVWRAVYSENYHWSDFTVTSNENVNYYNPMAYQFPMPTIQVRETIWDRLLVFESDSASDGLEIMAMVRPRYSGDVEFINVSNMPGNDRKPEILQYIFSTSEMVVMWEHETSEGSEIWSARGEFALEPGGVDRDEPNLPGFALSDNFPNPFNANTTINYELNESQYMSLKIWNIKGQIVASDSKVFRRAGAHSFEWNSGSLSSGVYFYSLSNGVESITKKCLLVK